MTLKEAKDRISELEEQVQNLEMQRIAALKAYHEVNTQFSAVQVQQADQELAKMQAAQQQSATETVD